MFPGCITIGTDGKTAGYALFPVGCGPDNFRCVHSADADAAYVFSDSTTALGPQSDLYTMEDPAPADIPEPIGAVMVHVQGRSTVGSATTRVAPIMRVDGQVAPVVVGPDFPTTTNYQTFTATFTTNPLTNAPWQVDDISMVNAGVQEVVGTGDQLRTTAVWVEICPTVFPLGGEFQVNTYTTHAQLRPAVASDSSGNFLVVWESLRQDSNGRVCDNGDPAHTGMQCTSNADCGMGTCISFTDFGIFAQRYDSGGSPAGTEFQVNSYTTLSQEDPAVAPGFFGTFVVVWTSTIAPPLVPGQDGDGAGVFGQRITAAGQPNGAEFQVNTYTTYDQQHPAVAVQGSGNFVVVWDSGTPSFDGQDGYGEGVFAQIFSRNGPPLGSEFRVNTYTTGNQNNPAVAAAANGNFVVVWSSYFQFSDYGQIVGQRFDAGGTPLGTEFQVHVGTTYDQVLPAVSSDSAGNFVVTWQDYSDGRGIFAQRFASDGSMQGTAFLVSSPLNGNRPSIASDPDGDFTIVWSEAVSAGNLDVFGSRFNSAGNQLGTTFQVNTFQPSIQNYPAVAANAAGNFVVVWESDTEDGDQLGVFGRRFEVSP